MHNIMNLPGSQVLQRIRGSIVANMLWAIAVSVRALRASRVNSGDHMCSPQHSATQHHFPPTRNQNTQFLFRFFNFTPIPSRVHTLLGSSLGLLLVFRTNASYGRYWEGR